MDAKILIMLFLFFSSVALVQWLVIDTIWNAVALDNKSDVYHQPAVRYGRLPLLFRRLRVAFIWIARTFVTVFLIYSFRGLWRVIRAISG